MTTKTDFYKQFLNTRSGTELLKKHSLSEVGIWLTRGEDSNCELGGYRYHHMPELGYREGKLEDVIREAVEMKSFWQWGTGGDIVKIQVKKASAMAAAAQACD